MVCKCFDKKSTVSCIKQNEQFTEESHKPIIRVFFFFFKYIYHLNLTEIFLIFFLSFISLFSLILEFSYLC